MLDKMISVSPPLKGEAPDSKFADSKTLRETSKSDYKKDFEKALNRRLDLKKRDLAEKKEAEPRNNELRAYAKEGKKVRKDDKEDKSLGGTKKKVTEVDDKMISNFMASIENKVEIPDSKIEDLAEIEIGATSSKNSLAHSDELMKADILAGPELTKIAQLSDDLMAEKSNQIQDSKNLETNFEAELKAAVGYTTEPEAQKSNQDLLGKLKAFENDKSLQPIKSQNFEQNVLSRLQNEQAFKINQVAEANVSSDGAGGSSTQQQDSSPLKDLKSDLADMNQLHQAAGQSHGDFRSQVAGTTATRGLSSEQMIENRETNINEIMNQAQYLVKKGGGEVTVKMSPEGLGEVHLKVVLQDGKLNVDIQTQNKDAKKLIEESLSDLKSGLAAQRLSVEHVKIDTVNATNADNNMQFQSNLNQGGSEGQMREFWNDFQSNMNNQSGRKSLYGDSNNESRGLSRNSSSAAANATGALRTYGGTKGSTVNRVA